MATASPRIRYALAAAAAGVAVLVACALRELPLHARLVVPLAATASCALLLGAGPGVLCLVAAGVGAPYFVLGAPTPFALGEGDAAALGLLAAAALPTIWAARGQREAHRHLQAERTARAAAEEQNRAKDEFLATLSHELRGPVGSILGWIDLLRGGLGERDAQRAIDSIARNAQTQAQLVAEVLDVSRIVTGHMRLELGDVDLPALLAAAIDSVRPKAVARAVVLEADVRGTGLVVRGDAARLAQVVSNLLDNAVKFTPQGGAVRACLRRVEASVQLEITDTGEGIPAELIPLLFERYRQVHRDRGRDGLGLGLSIVRHLVQRHGGTVRASSAGAGRGTTFTVELPIAGAAEPERAATARPSRALPESPPIAAQSPDRLMEKGIDR
jgi:signal transduction histidine kinase